MKTLITILFMSFAVASCATKYPDMDTFYSNPKNQKRFEAFQASEIAGKEYVVFAEGCRSGTHSAREKASCQCVARVVQSIPQREMFYDSYISYQIFQDMNKARRHNDSDTYERLKSFDRQRGSVGQKIKAACPEA